MSYNKIYELFTISFLKTDSQLFSSVQWNKHIEQFSRSLSCTLVTIIDCLFYAFDSLS